MRKVWTLGTIDGLPPLREVIAAHDLVAKRQLGQNFLLDLNLTMCWRWGPAPAG